VTEQFAFKNARWAIWTARFRRRARRLGAFAWASLTARPEARALTPAAWGFVAGWFGLAAGAHASLTVLIASLALFVPLCIAALIDALYFVLPDGPLLAVAGVGLLVRFIWSPDECASFLGAGLFAYLALALVARGYEALRGRAGLGGGDPMLFALAGLWLGWDGLAPCLLLATASALLSVLISAPLAWRSGGGVRFGDPLPFGPHIALGFWIVWTFGLQDPW
jgi:leader peptidase (prepilin peptidase)/N-methyltransferase